MQFQFAQVDFPALKIGPVVPQMKYALLNLQQAAQLLQRPQQPKPQLLPQQQQKHQQHLRRRVSSPHRSTSNL